MDLAKQQLEESLQTLQALADDHKGSNPDRAASAVKECKSCLKMVEMEIRTSGAVGEEKVKWKQWLKAKSEKIQELERQILFGRSSQSDSLGTKASSMAAREQQVTNRMAKQGASIAQSMSAVHETEVVAGAILSDLAVQRETIKSANSKIADVNTDLGYSSQLLTSMKSWWKIGSIQK